MTHPAYPTHALGGSRRFITSIPVCSGAKAMIPAVQILTS